MKKDALIGAEIDGYQVLEIIGQGGMGTVYLAQHPQNQHKVALKILKPEYCSQAAVVSRFFQEAKAVNEIGHPNVVQCSNFGKTPNDEYFIVMEYLEGETLYDALKCEGPLPLEKLGHIGLQICSALSAAHERGIIHRDLKSDNIFLLTHNDREDFVKVLDFGIAKILHGAHGDRPPTTIGTVVGTPLYMSPEQALGKEVDQKSDIYSLGVLLYQMATNTSPFFSENPFAVANMHVSLKPPSARSRRPDLPAALDFLLARCLEKNPKLRFPSMYEVALELGPACGLDPYQYFSHDGGVLLELAAHRRSLTPPIGFHASHAELLDTPMAGQVAALTEPTPAPKKPLSRVRVGVYALAVLLGGGSLYWAGSLHGGSPAQASATLLPATPAPSLPVMPASAPQASASAPAASLPVPSNQEPTTKVKSPTSLKTKSKTPTPPTTNPPPNTDLHHKTIDPFQ